MRRLSKTFGGLDILVVNVHIEGAAGTAVDVDIVQWAKSMGVHVASMACMCKYAIPATSSNDGQMNGKVVNKGSVAGSREEHRVYCT
jgi:NAD(P)-dependent dehydrogenase (short-subunit alcohol dehydrogenase family)